MPTFTWDWEAIFRDRYEMVVDYSRSVLLYTEIDNVYKNYIYIKPECFAPGIWAGSEGFVYKCDDLVFKVIEVDYDLKRLTVEWVESREI